MKKNTYIVCCNDENIMHVSDNMIAVEIAADSAENAIEEIKKAYPDYSVSYVFNKQDEEISAQTTERNAFINYCYDYGFEPSEYKAKVTLRGEIYTFVGFIPSNKKYKCSIVSENGRRRKTTRGLMRELLDNYRIS